MYESLQAISGKIGLPYHWLRENAVKGVIPAIRTSPTGKWMAQVEEVQEVLNRMKRVA